MAMDGALVGIKEKAYHSDLGYTPVLAMETWVRY
jgi:hypothetical protein